MCRVDRARDAGRRHRAVGMGGARGTNCEPASRPMRSAPTRLLAAALAERSDDRLAHLSRRVLHQGGTRRANPQPSSPSRCRRIGRAIDRRAEPAASDLKSKLKAAHAFQRTSALFTLAAEIGARVEQAKGRYGALDFQDLIDKTLALLSRGDAAWVLYKLDRGIDHVLDRRGAGHQSRAMGNPAPDHGGFHRRFRLPRRARCVRFSRWAIPSNRSSAFRARRRASSRKAGAIGSARSPKRHWRSKM